MVKDDIYFAGAKEPILVKYITQCLKNRKDEKEYASIRENYRNISKVLHAVNLHMESMEKPVGMIELCDIQKYYKLLVGIGNGEIATTVFDSKLEQDEFLIGRLFLSSELWATQLK